MRMKRNAARSTLGELVRVNKLRNDREIAEFFPGPFALQWHLRQCRADYVAAGALFEIAGRLFAHPAKFKECMLAIGARNLARPPASS